MFDIIAIGVLIFIIAYNLDELMIARALKAKRKNLIKKTEPILKKVNDKSKGIIKLSYNNKSYFISDDSDETNPYTKLQAIDPDNILKYGLSESYSYKRIAESKA